MGSRRQWDMFHAEAHRLTKPQGMVVSNGGHWAVVKNNEGYFILLADGDGKPYRLLACSPKGQFLGSEIGELRDLLSLLTLVINAETTGLS